jgi:pSer/pThr/pTyr-binding forkhead associated (FHA) protein
VRIAGDGQVPYLIKKSLRIGRAPGNDVVIDDTKASRGHALLGIYSGEVFIRDLDSLNGTFVNGEMVAGDHLLQDGDIVAIGDTGFIYHNDFEALTPTSR